MRGEEFYCFVATFGHSSAGLRPQRKENGNINKDLGKKKSEELDKTICVNFGTQLEIFSEKRKGN